MRAMSMKAKSQNRSPSGEKQVLGARRPVFSIPLAHQYADIKKDEK
jgi:hypothetical protein